MVDDLKEEFGLVIARKDNVLRELRECCAELEGVDVTTGRIIYCRVEKAVDGRNWKVVVRKGKQLPQLPAKLSTEGSVVSREEEELMEFYRTLDPEKRVLIDSRRDTIVTSRITVLMGCNARRQPFSMPFENISNPTNILPALKFACRARWIFSVVFHHSQAHRWTLRGF